MTFNLESADCEFAQLGVVGERLDLGGLGMLERDKIWSTSDVLLVCWNMRSERAVAKVFAKECRRHPCSKCNSRVQDATLFSTTKTTAPPPPHGE
jgi:hypothetical protein